ncbi:MAG: type I methionyl aminopeptidase [Saccharopolyspora sp.]|uniref:type I methionyl aminopeptidase n=1 Tax=Saccharopolyspora TaxID=1835 RepID=UPI00190C3279|nr:MULTISPECIES: type I methionyl aminopeptidase [unclassified Saccharopolyspora]MBK0866379.1 type I methionyl aminopeptidase [Saccharopolyspora sp. HNM0986]MBQ6642349.1 type I methionyl aminopeptidase [Saccharopolyspora sp.]
MFRRGKGIELKSAGEIEAMRAAGLVVARALAAVSAAAKPGVSTGELDEIAEQTIRDARAVPSFQGYHGFPASICTSLNEKVVHGIPSKSEVLAEGDLLSVDCGAILEGWHGDSAVSIGVGELSSRDRALSEATRKAMWAGLQRAEPGKHLSDISYAVQTAAQTSSAVDGVDYGIIAEYGGHGIGTEMHMEPFLPNLGKPGRGPKLRVGMALAVEPMLTLGSAVTRELDDEWTVVTFDGSRASHWEHTVAITENGPWVLTEAEDADAR